MLSTLPKPGAYVRLWKAAYAEADAGRIVRLEWGRRDLDAAAVRREFRRALDRRINIRGGLSECGRNYDHDQQVRFARDQRRVQDRVVRRIVVRQFETRAARERFGHLLTTDDAYTPPPRRAGRRRGRAG